MVLMLIGAGILLVGVIFGAAIASPKTKTGDNLYYSEEALARVESALRLSDLNKDQIKNVIDDMKSRGVWFQLNKIDY
jgi:hypothetical protein